MMGKRTKLPGYSTWISIGSMEESGLVELGASVVTEKHLDGRWDMETWWKEWRKEKEIKKDAICVRWKLWTHRVKLEVHIPSRDLLPDRAGSRRSMTRNGQQPILRSFEVGAKEISVDAGLG
jgi:hypothetical protein